MPLYSDFNLAAYADGTLTIQLTPATNISAWAVEYYQTKRFGNLSGTIVKSMASGFAAGESGITIVSSGQGTFNVNLWHGEMSGRDPGNFAYEARRTNSGFHSIIARGYRLA